MASKPAFCDICGKYKNINAKKCCSYCYQKHRARRIECPLCKKNTTHAAKGLCRNCYNKKFHYDRIKANQVKRHFPGLPYYLYKKLTRKCIICEFSAIVELHHIDYNHKNNDKFNLVGLCPNHHKMLHHEKYKEKIFNLLKKLLKK